MNKNTPKIILALLAAVGFFVFIYRDLIFGLPTRDSVLVGQPLPDLSLMIFDGSERSLLKILEPAPQQKPKKFIINLWATWCEPCVRELPIIQQNLARLEKENTEVLLVNYDGGPPAKALVEVRAWLLAQNVQMTSYFDFQELLLQKLNIEGLPYTIGVDASKKIQWMELGELDWAKQNISVK